MRTRPHKLSLRLNDDELMILNADTDRAGLSREAYLRSLILSRPIKERPTDIEIDVLVGLQQISNNMNQIAMKAHSIGFIDTDAYWENVEELKSVVLKMLRRIYG